MMVLHLRSLDETSLARKIYEEQKEKGWPGLARETKYICTSLKIEDCNITQIGRNKYREYVTKACHILNEERLRSQASDIKCARIATERYCKKEYMGQTRQEVKRPKRRAYFFEFNTFS